MSYERKPRTGIMLCQPFEESRLLGSSRKAWNTWPVIVQPKLDGERCRALFFNGKWILLSSTEELIVSVPHINNALTNQFPDGGPEFDGELYLHGLDFEGIHSIVSRTVNQHPDFAAMEYHIFDYVSTDAQSVRTVNLANKYQFSYPLIKVPFSLAWNFSEVMAQYAELIEKGYEGMILRHTENIYERKRSTLMMKFKPKKEDLYEIVGFKQELDKHGVPKNSLGALILTSDEGTQFSVGSGFTAEQRQNYWQVRDSLIGKHCLIKYQHMTAGGVTPRFPIFTKIL